MLLFIKDVILDILYPSYCFSCGKYLLGDHRIVACRKCWDSYVVPFKGFRCKFCGLPLDSLNSVSENLCKSCFYENNKKFFDGMSYFGLYDNLLKIALHELKIERKKEIAIYIGKKISFCLKKFICENQIDVLTYVPMHIEELKDRGFEQCKLILDATKLPYRKILNKDFRGKKQAFLKKEERAENIKGLFSLKKEFIETVKGKSVCVFDDIYTTGSTVSEIAKILKSAGASKVFVYTVARSI